MKVSRQILKQYDKVKYESVPDRQASFGQNVVNNSIQTPKQITAIQNKTYRLVLITLVLALVAILLYLEQGHQHQNSQTQVNSLKKQELDLFLAAVEAIQSTSKQQKFKNLHAFIQNSQSNKMNDPLFNLPKRAWLFHSKNFQNLDHLQKLYIENIKYFTAQSGFELVELNQKNYNQFLSQSSQQRVSIIKSFIRQSKEDIYGNPKNHMKDILKRIISLLILQEQGGVMINEYLMLAQDLNWVQQISSSLHSNYGNKGSKPRVFSFFYDGHSSIRKKYNKLRSPQYQKYMTIFPGIETYFIAAQKGSEYITDLIHEIFRIILSPDKAKEMIIRQKIQTFDIYIKDLYDSFFSLGSQIVIQKKQKELDNLVKDRNLFAIDYYGLRTINCYLFTFKLKLFYSNIQQERIYYQLTKIDITQFQKIIGPMRYIAFLHPYSIIQQRLIKNSSAIIHNSFLQKMLYPKSSIQTSNEARVQVNWKNWTTLPKYVWIYQKKGVIPTITSQMTAANLKRKARQSGFQVRIINDENVKDYIGDLYFQDIMSIVQKSKIKVKFQTQLQLYILATLIKNGGVYIAPTYVLTSNFDWLLKIAQNTNMTHRFGDLPQVLMFNGIKNYLIQQEISKGKDKQKIINRSFDLNLIAAEAQSIFIKQWFSKMISFYTNPAQITAKSISECYSNSKTARQKTNQQFSLENAAHCVMVTKQNGLQNGRDQNAFDYFKLWSIDNKLINQKICANTNYEKPISSNKYPYLYQYSQNYVQSIVGNFYHLVNIDNSINQMLSQFIAFNIQKLKQEVHPQSLFSQYLFDRITQSIQNQNGRIVVIQKK